MKVKDRIKDFRRVPARELLPHPKNWRTHPPAQQDALRGILAEVGIADAAIAYETRDGLRLIDGHLRAEALPDTPIPVLVLDVTDGEADKLLLSLDPLAAMAGADAERLDALLAEVDTDSDALRAAFESLAGGHGEAPAEEGAPAPAPDESAAFPEKYQVLIDCDTEAEQAALLGRLSAEGLRCRSLIS